MLVKILHSNKTIVVMAVPAYNVTLKGVQKMGNHSRDKTVLVPGTTEYNQNETIVRMT